MLVGSVFSNRLGAPEHLNQFRFFCNRRQDMCLTLLLNMMVSDIKWDELLLSTIPVHWPEAERTGVSYIVVYFLV